MNNYQYVNNPTGWVDPLGLNECPGANKGPHDPKAKTPASGAVVDQGQPSPINIDTGTANAFVSQNSPVRHQLKETVQGKQMVMTETASSELKNITSKIAGPQEKARSERFMENVKVIPDAPSERAISLKLTKKVGENDKIIFGTGDKIGAPTMTSDAKFIRGASSQGVDFDTIVHDPAPLKVE